MILQTGGMLRRTCNHSGSRTEDPKHGSPSGAKIVHTGLKHLLHTLQNHIAAVRVIIVNHCEFEGLEKVFLEAEVGEFLLLQEAHSQLSQRIKRKKSDASISVTAHLGKLPS